MGFDDRDPDGQRIHAERLRAFYERARELAETKRELSDDDLVAAERCGRSLRDLRKAIGEWRSEWLSRNAAADTSLACHKSNGVVKEPHRVTTSAIARPSCSFNPLTMRIPSRSALGYLLLVPFAT